MFRKLLIFSFFAMAIFGLFAGDVLATTKYDYTSCTTCLTKQSPYTPNDKDVHIQRVVIDFDDIGGGVSNADVVQVLTIPAGTFVSQVGVFLHELIQ